MCGDGGEGWKAKSKVKIRTEGAIDTKDEVEMHGDKRMAVWTRMMM